MDFQFKVPGTLPQDLLLIQDIVGPIPSSGTDFERSLGQPRDSNDDPIGSSDKDVESEEEVEADLLGDNENVAQSSTALPDMTSESESDLDSDTDSESTSSSLSENDKLQETTSSHKTKITFDIEDEDSGTSAAPACLQTKNEIVDVDIIVPTISEVEPDDNLEKIGEIMSIVGNIVIVKGLPADQVRILSERALDAESLLVFEDRKVLGYIYETFGPTSQPLYQIKFNQHYPLDTERIRVAREVFHVPNRSHFVLVNQLTKLRGSDASNIHDEEPAEDEIEFSDDEEEAAYKQRHRKRRGQSALSSRQSTPASSRSHIDDVVDDAFYGTNPYDAHGPYDDDFSMTRPPRPIPMPYDDPYTEPTDMKTITYSSTERSSAEGGHDDRSSAHCDWENTHGKAHNSAPPRTSHDHRPGRGSLGKPYRNRPFRNARRGYKNQSTTSEGTSSGPSLTPTPYGEFATAQFTANTAAYTSGPPGLASWSCPSSNLPPQNYYPPFVQPHINPRFASAFGINLQGGSGQWQQPQNSPYPTLTPQQGWDDQWTVHETTGSDRNGYGPM